MKRKNLIEALRMLAFFIALGLFFAVAILTYGYPHRLWQYGLLALAILLCAVAGLGDDPVSTPDFIQRWLDYRGKP